MPVALGARRPAQARGDDDLVVLLGATERVPVGGRGRAEAPASSVPPQPARPLARAGANSEPASGWFLLGSAHAAEMVDCFHRCQCAAGHAAGREPGIGKAKARCPATDRVGPGVAREEDSPLRTNERVSGPAK